MNVVRNVESEEINRVILKLTVCAELNQKVNQMLAYRDELTSLARKSGGMLGMPIRQAEERLNNLTDAYADSYEEIMNMLLEIPASEADILIKYYLHGMKVKEIAEHLGYSQSTVKKLKRQGLENLAEIK